MFEVYGKSFDNQDLMFDYLRQNKDLIKVAKKSAIKYADAISFQIFDFETENSEIIKSIANEELLKLDSFNAKVVINTTNLMDSHKDVHLPGIWNKSLKENKNIYLLQEHQMKFDSVIADDIKAFVQTLSFKSLGVDFDGTTQALIFDSKIEKGRNEFMTEQYAKGRVKNHSVGMQYVKLYLAMNSNNRADKVEKETWDKYINEIANKEEAFSVGYFWAVTEAKVIEGSAVLRGSNYVTPTLNIGKSEPSEDTQLKNKLFNLKNK
jgi:hypothetical protein